MMEDVGMSLYDERKKGKKMLTNKKIRIAWGINPLSGWFGRLEDGKDMSFKVRQGELFLLFNQNQH